MNSWMDRYCQAVYRFLNTEITVYDAIEKGLLLLLLGLLIYWLVTDFAFFGWVSKKDGKTYELRARSGKVEVEE